MKILKNINEITPHYEKTRNTLNISTTNLSAYLNFGCVSIREAFYILKKKFVINSPLVRQLIWREFYYHLGYGFIDRFGKSLKIKYDKIKWGNNSSWFKKWKEGKTGFPIVDACMMQLNTTGYMHNRGRLIVSSFLIKNLITDNNLVFPNTVYGASAAQSHPEFMKTWLAYIGYIMGMTLIVLHVVFIGNNLLYKVDNAIILGQTIYFFSFVQLLVGKLLSQFYYGWVFTHFGFFPNIFSNTIPANYV
jgi:hypothetical protein